MSLRRVMVLPCGTRVSFDLGGGMVAATVLAASLLSTSGAAIAKLPDQLDARLTALGVPIVRIAQVAPIQEYLIEPGPLGDALVKLSQQSGLRISFSSNTVTDLSTPGVAGTMSGSEALTRLMSGTGLKVRKIGKIGFVILPPPVRTSQATELQGIIVTGEKEDRTLFDTPSSVGVVTSVDIENSTILGRNDVLDRVVNVQRGGGSTAVKIRGIRNSGVVGQVSTSAPSLTVYLDNVPLSGLSSGTQSLWDIEQVEVLRGVQSTKQGRNALAGAIHIKSKDPVYRNEASTRVGFANNSEYLTSVMANAPLINNVLAARLAFDFTKTDGFITNPTLGIDDQQEESERNFRGKLRFDPKILEGFTNVLTLNYIKSRRGQDAVDSTDIEKRLTFGNIQGIREVDQTLVSLNSRLKIQGPWSLKNIFTWSRTDSGNSFDQNGTLAASNHVIANTTFPAGLNELGNVEGSISSGRVDAITEELRLHYDGKRVKAHAGYYFANIRRTGSGNNLAGTDLLDPTTLGAFFIPTQGLVLANLYPGRLLIDNTSNSKIEETNHAVFGELSYNVTPFLTVFGGMRYDQVHQKRSLASSFVFDNLPADTGNPFNPIDQLNALARGLETSSLDVGSADSDAVLPSGGATLNFSDDLNVSVLAKRGYRAGGGASGSLGTAFTYDPEFVWNYELALRSRWLDNRVQVNANVFQMDWTDMQVNQRVPSPVVPGAEEFILTNAATSRLRGFELEMRAQPTDAWSLFANLGYVKTEFLEFIDLNGNDRSGNEFPGAPRWTMSLGAQYNFSNGVFVQADANYQSDAFVAVSNDPGRIQDARTIVNARIGYQNETLSVYGFATNLFDETYSLTSGRVAGSLTNPSSNIDRLGDGRTYGMRFNMKFQ
ncbi:MAG: TonB-dependent receptor [Pseudomonadota bacterium]